MLLSAFEININRTGKLSIKYINGILKSWVERELTNRKDFGG
jgi:DNA replication protein DnaD